VVTPEKRMRREHPLRRVKLLLDAALKDLWATFEKM
jgi:hypothetical protein